MSEEKITPLEGIRLKENRILIKRFGLEEKVGSIYMPASEQEAKKGGTVVSVGPGKVDPVTGVLVPNVCKVGETVRFLEHGMEIEHGGEDYYLARDSDVWGDID